MRTHRSFPSMDVWLRYDRGFWRKSACSPVPLDWGSTDLEVFHQSYTSSKVLQPAALSVVSSLRGAPPRGEAQGSSQPQKSAAPGTAVIALAVSHSANASTSAPSVKGLTAPSRVSVTPAATAPASPSRAYRLTNRRRSPLLSFLHSRFLWLVAICRQVLRFFLVSRLFKLFCARPSFPTRPPTWPPLPPPAAVSPIKFYVLASELRQHPFLAFRDYLLSGFEQGITVGFLPSLVLHLHSTSTNMKSALLKRDVVKQYLAKEVSLGRVVSVSSSHPPPARYTLTVSASFQSMAVPANGG